MVYRPLYTKVLQWRKSPLADCCIIHHRHTQEGDLQPVSLLAEQSTLGLHQEELVFVLGLEIHLHQNRDNQVGSDKEGLSQQVVHIAVHLAEEEHFLLVGSLRGYHHDTIITMIKLVGSNSWLGNA